MLEFEDGYGKYSVGTKHFHSEMGVYCTVTERTESDDGALTSFKVRLEGLDAEAVIENNPEALKALKTDIDVIMRVINTTGTKSTIEGSIDLGKNFKKNITGLFTSAGLKMSNFKIFHNDKLVDSKTDLSSIVEVGKETYLFAVESMGKPTKWMRFPRVYEYSNWS